MKDYWAESAVLLFHGYFGLHKKIYTILSRALQCSSLGERCNPTQGALKCARKDHIIFFFIFLNYAPSEMTFSRLSGINCNKAFFINRTERRLEKATSIFEKRVFANDSFEPAELHLGGFIIRKIFI